MRAALLGKSVLVLSFLLFFMTSAPHTAFAQFPSKFYIGAFWVGGESQQSWCEDPGPIKFLSPYIDGSGNPETISLYGLEKPCELMPQARLRQMDSLGLNLGGFHFNDPNVTVASGRNAIVENLNRTLEVAMTFPDVSKNIDICAFTWTTDNEGRGDRIMLHPEDTLDFKVKTGTPNTDYTILTNDDFDNLSMTGLNLSRCIERGGSGNNCVRITGPCSFSGVPLKRKRELSAFHSEMPSPTDTELNSGLYHVSVILRPVISPPPPNGTVVLTVRITGADSALTVNSNAVTTHVLEMSVKDSAFYDGGVPRSGPFELHVGRIELQVDRYTKNPPALDSVLTVANGVLADRWYRTGSFLTNRLKYWDELNPYDTSRNIVKEFDIELIAKTDYEFYLDAVCLTSPHSYGLFAPNDTNNVLAAHRPARAKLDTFMRRLTQYRGGGRLSRVSLITVPEQDPYVGYWRNTRLLQGMIRNYTRDAMGNTTCMAYSAKGSVISTTDLPGLVEFHRDMASGYYAYAYDIEYPRWAIETEPNDYYSWTIFGDPGAQPGIGRIWDNVRYYRRYAQERKDHDLTSPWIPFVQNHSNNTLLQGDGDTMRQPNAAELKLMCNIGLAHGAKGLMFYQFNTHGTDPAVAAAQVPPLPLRPLWPQTWEEYKADSTCNLDDPFGSIGFLAGGNRRDTVDVHGENKWDSTRKLINDFLRPVGERLLPMTWEMSRSWYAARGGGEQGESRFVSGITTSRLGTSGYAWVDHQDTTLIETAEFKGIGDTTFVFVVNMRAHKEGQRHACVKLSSEGGTQYKVTDLRNGDVHIVLASDDPDQQSISDGLRLYLDRGEATLLKLEPMDDVTSTFDPCLPSNLYVWQGAELHTTNNQELSFNSGCGIFSEGTFITAPGTRLQPCVEPWLGVFSRNGGNVELNTTTVIQGSLNVGPLSDALLTDNCEFVECDIALNNLGGYLVSQSTIATSCREYLYQADGVSILDGDSVNTWNTLTSQEYAIHILDGNLYFKRLRLLNQHRGIYASNNAMVYAGIPGDFTSPRNKIICNNLALHAEGQSYIVVGIESSGTWYYNDNMFQLLWSPQTWWPSSQIFHALSNSYIAAQQNYWMHPGAPPAILPDVLTSGYVEWDPNLILNPVPFTGGGRNDNMSAASSGPMSAAYAGNDPVKQILGRMAANDSTGARNALGLMISANALDNAQPHQLNALAHFTQRHSRGHMQSVITALDNRNELSCKLILSDLFRGQGLYDDALRTLYSYGFGGVSPQARQAHTLKAMTYAMDRRYGYGMGVKALDSLRAQLASDSSYLRFVELYPYLYSGLDVGVAARTPKETEGALVYDMPTDCQLLPPYPNPAKNETYVTIRLDDSRRGRLVVYNMYGGLMTEREIQDCSRGTHTFRLNTALWTSGLYVVKLILGTDVLTQKLLLTH